MLSSHSITPEQLEEIRKAFRDYPGLIKIRRYWKKPTPGAAPEARTPSEPFTELEFKLKLSNSLVISREDPENPRLFGLQHQQLGQAGRHNVKVKPVHYLGLLNPSSTKSDPYLLLPQVVKIEEKEFEIGEPDPRSLLLMELRILKNLGDATGYALRYKGYKEKDTHYIFQKRAPGVNLVEYRKQEFAHSEQKEKDTVDEIINRTEKQLRLTINLLKVLRQFHRRGFLHRDIKLQNVMYDPHTEEVTLIDFGMSIRNVGDKNSCQELAGTKGYYDPDLLATLPVGPCVYSMSTDIYPMTLVIRDLWWFGTPKPLLKAVMKSVDRIIWDLQKRRKVPAIIDSAIDQLESLLLDIANYKEHSYVHIYRGVPNSDLLEKEEKVERVDNPLMKESKERVEEKKSIPTKPVVVPSSVSFFQFFRNVGNVIKELGERNRYR